MPPGRPTRDAEDMIRTERDFPLPSGAHGLIGRNDELVIKLTYQDAG